MDQVKFVEDNLLAGLKQNMLNSRISALTGLWHTVQRTWGFKRRKGCTPCAKRKNLSGFVAKLELHLIHLFY